MEKFSEKLKEVFEKHEGFIPMEAIVELIPVDSILTGKSSVLF